MITTPTPDEVNAQLRRILESAHFANSRRLSQFLEFVVTARIHDSEIKESLIGVQVYGREPDYNPKEDSIVRAEASRLRAKLREYYEEAGGADPIRIELPKGSYQPQFIARPAPEIPAPQPGVETRPPALVAAPLPPPATAAPYPRRPSWIWLVAAVAGLTAIAAVFITPRLTGRAEATRPHTIAVAPLGSSRPNQPLATLGDNLTESIRRALLDSGHWKVLAPAALRIESVGKDEMLAQLRASSRAEVVLTGDLQPAGGPNLRVNLELVNVADGYLLWSHTGTTLVSKLADTQADFARSTVNEFTQTFTGRNLSGRGADYMRARELWSAGSYESLKQSVPLFEKATRAEPNFAPAWAGLADAAAELSDKSPELNIDHLTALARQAAEKAISLDESNAEAHSVLGWIYLGKQWNFREAIREFSRALAADPLRVSPNNGYSMALSITGDLAGAAEAIRVARIRLPFVPELLFQEGSVFFLAHKFEKMEDIGREMLTLDPNSVLGRWLIGLSFERRGRVKDAIREFETALKQAARDDLRCLCALGHSYGMLGDRERALATMRRYLDPTKKEITRYTLSYCAALTYASLGDRDQAFAWLEKARIGRDNSFPFFPLDPRFDSLRNDARYTALVESLRQGSK